MQTSIWFWIEVFWSVQTPGIFCDLAVHLPWLSSLHYICFKNSMFLCHRAPQRQNHSLIERCSFCLLKKFLSIFHAQVCRPSHSSEKNVYSKIINFFLQKNCRYKSIFKALLNTTFCFFWFFFFFLERSSLELNLRIWSLLRSLYLHVPK